MGECHRHSRYGQGRIAQPEGDMDIVLLIFVGIAVAIIFAVSGVWLGHRLLRGRLADGNHDVLVALFQTGGTLRASTSAATNLRRFSGIAASMLRCIARPRRRRFSAVS
jgi:hypothetical protein